ncbi:inorganic phosphate transporter [Actinokineospora globicatena]|uniref:inorganic phosphate transporter n=1 Tax=Actinokineospora globicatena TaxID=103729 RepID=UPI0020A306FC|nr:inorganic phosphate transporter [Actinokineospora globicatena]MCP2303735.1 inorganic phosphate transporter, PiT family [Actinokineospora globicatena]GLW79116.1 phosphate transporter [Actinokineospora globicatena]GLW86474.1 phosphate transporter [Actinokineospora globicatena]
MDVSLIVVVVVITALAFDFTNGFHDTANAMATSIATGALKPKEAVGIAAVLNLVGAFLSIEVAKTISSGIVDETRIGPAVIFGGLVGAIVWNLLTWLVGLPSSSSHALFGGLIGAVWVASGSDAVRFTTVLEKVVVPAVASPLIAGLVAMIATFLAYRITHRTGEDTRRRGFRVGQVVTASLVALAHGTNDAQKTMGVITLTLITAGSLPAAAGPPLWVIISAGSAIALGTYLGGWRIIRTMGRGITDIGPPQGFAAEASAAAVILTSSHVGFALSTTHVVSGGVIGSGVGRRLAEVRWSTAGRMVVAWALTLPAAALVGAGAGWVAGTGAAGTVIVAIAAAAICGGIYWLSRRNPISAHNVNDAATV